MSLEHELSLIVDKELAQKPSFRGFKEFHANGLPVLDDRTAIDKYRAEAGTPELVENDVPSSFYTHVPPGSAAQLSRFDGRLPFRFVQHFLPERRIFHWSVPQVHSVCKSLARKQWRAVMLARNRRPNVNTQLYDYFDSYDLYHYGAVNLANVLAGICNLDYSNLLRVHSLLETAACKWVVAWASQSRNAYNLLHFPAPAVPITSCLPNHDSGFDLDRFLTPALRSCLVEALTQQKRRITDWEIGLHVSQHASLTEATATLAHYPSGYLTDNGTAMVSGRPYYPPRWVQFPAARDSGTEAAATLNFQINCDTFSHSPAALHHVQEQTHFESRSRSTVSEDRCPRMTSRPAGENEARDETRGSSVPPPQAMSQDRRTVWETTAPSDQHLRPATENATGGVVASTGDTQKPNVHLEPVETAEGSLQQDWDQQETRHPDAHRPMQTSPQPVRGEVDNLKQLSQDATIPSEGRQSEQLPMHEVATYGDQGNSRHGPRNAPSTPRGRRTRPDRSRYLSPAHSASDQLHGQEYMTYGTIPTPTSRAYFRAHQRGDHCATGPPMSYPQPPPVMTIWNPPPMPQAGHEVAHLPPTPSHSQKGRSGGSRLNIRASSFQPRAAQDVVMDGASNMPGPGRAPRLSTEHVPGATEDSLLNLPASLSAKREFGPGRVRKLAESSAADQTSTSAYDGLQTREPAIDALESTFSSSKPRVALPGLATENTVNPVSSITLDDTRSAQGSPSTATCPTTRSGAASGKELTAADVHQAIQGAASEKRHVRAEAKAGQTCDKDFTRISTDDDRNNVPASQKGAKIIQFGDAEATTLLPHALRGTESQRSRCAQKNIVGHAPDSSQEKPSMREAFSGSKKPDAGATSNQTGGAPGTQSQSLRKETQGPDIKERGNYSSSTIRKRPQARAGMSALLAEENQAEVRVSRSEKASNRASQAAPQVMCRELEQTLGTSAERGSLSASQRSLAEREKDRKTSTFGQVRKSTEAGSNNPGITTKGKDSAEHVVYQSSGKLSGNFFAVLSSSAGPQERDSASSYDGNPETSDVEMATKATAQNSAEVEMCNADLDVKEAAGTSATNATVLPDKPGSSSKHSGKRISKSHKKKKKKSQQAARQQELDVEASNDQALQDLYEAAQRDRKAQQACDEAHAQTQKLVEKAQRSVQDKAEMREIEGPKVSEPQPEEEALASDSAGLSEQESDEDNGIPCDIDGWRVLLRAPLVDDSPSPWSTPFGINGPGVIEENAGKMDGWDPSNDGEDDIGINEPWPPSPTGRGRDPSFSGTAEVALNEGADPLANEEDAERPESAASTVTFGRDEA